MQIFFTQNMLTISTCYITRNRSFYYTYFTLASLHNKLVDKLDNWGENNNTGLAMQLVMKLYSVICQDSFAGIFLDFTIFYSNKV